MKKQEVRCETCGKHISRYPSQVQHHNFCSRECARAFTSRRMSDYNRQENPINTPEGWNAEQKEAVRQREQRNKGPCGPDTYPKNHERHEHRKVAEQILGRKLRPGEAVHKDRDKHNNNPSNIMIFSSQAEHVKWHAEHDEEVMPV